MVNHAVFKGLLYLSTGAIEKLAGTVEYRRLGGLFKNFPWTASAFLFGAIAIAGFPPFNGFISEWLTFQALLLSFQIPDVTVNLAFAIAIAVLALTAGLAAAVLGIAYSLLAWYSANRCGRC